LIPGIFRGCSAGRNPVYLLASAASGAGEATCRREFHCGNIPGMKSRPGAQGTRPLAGGRRRSGSINGSSNSVFDALRVSRFNTATRCIGNHRRTPRRLLLVEKGDQVDFCRGFSESALRSLICHRSAQHNPTPANASLAWCGIPSTALTPMTVMRRGSTFLRYSLLIVRSAERPRGGVCWWGGRVACFRWLCCGRTNPELCRLFDNRRNEGLRSIITNKKQTIRPRQRRHQVEKHRSPPQ